MMTSICRSTRYVAHLFGDVVISRKPIATKKTFSQSLEHVACSTERCACHDDNGASGPEIGRRRQLSDQFDQTWRLVSDLLNRDPPR
jgi:hypothetical protein